MQSAKTVGAVTHTHTHTHTLTLLVEKKQSMKYALLIIQKNDCYARDG